MSENCVPVRNIVLQLYGRLSFDRFCSIKAFFHNTTACCMYTLLPVSHLFTLLTFTTHVLSLFELNINEKDNFRNLVDLIRHIW